MKANEWRKVTNVVMNLNYVVLCAIGMCPVSLYSAYTEQLKMFLRFPSANKVNNKI